MLFQERLGLLILLPRRLAVTVVIKAIRDGDIPTAKWYLTKKRKDEFGDAIDVTSGGKPLIIDWDDDN